MLEQVVEVFSRGTTRSMVDATVGLGGHAAALLARLPDLRLVGLDVDPSAIARAREELAVFGERARVLHATYLEIDEVLRSLGITEVDGVLFDLGVSSLQLDTPDRGFSFRHDAPLDMRFSGSGVTAAELLASLAQEDLERILRELGEEPRARRVAREIVRAQSRTPIETTGQLHRIVLAALGGRRGRIDPATRTFQALRLATTRELDGIPAAIEKVARLLRPGGRIAAIAFHSLEDRLVKRTLRRLSGRCVCPPGTFACHCDPVELLEVLTAHPMRPDDAEIAANPRARSARLRVAARRPE